MLLAPICVTGFLCAVFFILYVLVGYPLLLGWRARHHPRSVARGPFEPTVSIVIAVRNGGTFLEEKLRSVLALDYPREKIQVLVVSDGSTDQTDSIARQFESKGITLLSVPPGGKAAALNAGIAQASGALLVLTDVRQQLSPDSLRLLAENFADPSVGAASAELVIRKGDNLEEASVGLYWRYELWIRLRLSEIDSIFGATGAYYALRRELAVPLPPDTLLDDMYLPLSAFFKGYRLIVDPRARMFDYPTGIQSEFRRKVRTLAGNYQILQAYPQLLGPSNRLWLHFVSYKFARLVLPFALLALAGFSAGLPSPWNWWALAAQAGFLLLALCDLWMPDNSPLKRLTSPIRTFTVLMASALCAVSIFFLPSASLWKASQTRQAR